MGKFALLRYLSEVSTKNFVGLIIENSKSNHLGAQGTFKGSDRPDSLDAVWLVQDIRLLQSFCARANHPCLARSHLHCPNYCKIIARLLRNIDPPPTPLVYAIHHTQLVLAISCKGQDAMRAYLARLHVGLELGLIRV